MEENLQGKKKNNIKLIVLAIGLLLIVVGIILFLVNGNSKNDNNGNKNNDNEPEEKENNTEAEKFEGIYLATQDKMVIHKKNNTEFNYNIGGNFIGVATVNGNTAKEKSYNSEDAHFEFKLVENGIEVTYVANEDVEVATDTGIYTKVADYSKDNVYKEIMGDPQYLTSKYSGLYSNGDFKFYVIQRSETEFRVVLDNSSDNFLILDEKFTLEGDNKLVSKSFFDETMNAYEITFNEKEFTLKCNENVFGFDENYKQLELTYTFEKELTQDEIYKEFLQNY